MTGTYQSRLGGLGHSRTSSSKIRFSEFWSRSMVAELVEALGWERRTEPVEVAGWG